MMILAGGLREYHQLLNPELISLWNSEVISGSTNSYLFHCNLLHQKINNYAEIIV